MRTSYTVCLATLLLAAPFAQAQDELSEPGAPAATAAPAIEEIRIWGRVLGQRSGNTNPVSLITREDLLAINVQTTEDIVKYEPSLVIRRRFIGDSNGTMGIRGSNMFQTPRSLVFADGVPLHYLLQSRWNGSPRWSMVAASEIAQLEVLYGPFSAEYSGNAMGGVVLIESAIPQQREFHFDSSAFVQQFDAYGFDDTLRGNKTFMSFGDRIGDLSLYFSVNRLDNESQPQIYYYGAPTAEGPDARPAAGGIIGPDERGRSQLWFGDSGSVETLTHNYKFKAAYDYGDWTALLNVAYEDRDDSNLPNSYLRDSAGAAIFGGTASQDGRTVSLSPAILGAGEQRRDSLSLGLRLKGPLTDSVSLEANLNQFSILRDRSRNTLRHPGDIAYTGDAQLTDFDDTGWQSAELKLFFDDLGVDGVRLVSGARFERYSLGIDVFDAIGGQRSLRSRTGGETDVAAIFSQLSWNINNAWDLTLGGRLERFRSLGGYYSDDDPATPAHELVQVPGNRHSDFSPKLSVGYAPNDDWSFRYSLARAVRYPIVEELFSQYQAYNAINQANPELRPEDGVHHNLSIERDISQGYLRLNLFHEDITDVIEAQSTSLPGGVSVRTFVPVDEVRTQGAEFIMNTSGLFMDNLDLRFNVSYTEAQIMRNRVAPQLEGNMYPRMPKWRGNLLMTWHLSESWTAGLNYQYASDSYGLLDNSDRQNRVYGAQDAYSRIGLKTDYRFSNGLTVGAGIDNISNRVDWVAHPWPGRTAYVNLSWDM